MNIEKDITSFILADSVFIVLAIIYQGAITATTQELVSTRNRFTVTSLGYNISYGFFGGTAPLFVSWIADRSGITIIPGIYLTVFALLALVAIYKLNETHKVQLE